MYYTIYKTTNKVNGKIYIGCHKTNNLDDGYLGSGKLLGRAIEKYGVENFEKEILHIFNKASEMFEMESELVNEEFVKRDDTYNLNEGGYGGFNFINENNLNIDLKKQIERNPELCEIASKKGNETKSKKWENDKEWAKKYRKSISKGLMKFYKDGGRGGFTGKQHSTEFKEQLSAVMKEKSKGENNSQYGTMWICNIELKENKKIKKNEEIPEGWMLGRNKWKNLPSYDEHVKIFIEYSEVVKLWNRFHSGKFRSLRHFEENEHIERKYLSKKFNKFFNLEKNRKLKSNKSLIIKRPF